MNRHPALPRRAVLDDVPKIGYHVGDRYYFTPFISCLRSCMTYLGEDYTYAYLMGVSGAAFRLVWNSKEWDGGNVDIVFVAEDRSECFRRAFEATGYAFDYLERAQSDETTFRQRIMASIRDAKHPVMAQGIIGPPEVCIVSGYDDGGDVLIGWSFFQGSTGDFPQAEFEPSGYFRKRDWFEHTPGLITIGDKQDAPPVQDLYRQALDWALHVVRTPVVHEFYGGLRAYEAWAEWMQRDEDFPDDLAVLGERKMVHYDATCMVSERGHAATFLREIAAHEPAAAAALAAAADCYNRETSLLGKMHEAIGGFVGSDEQLRILADPAARQGIAAAALQARELDAKAADHLERALDQLGR